MEPGINLVSSFSSLDPKIPFMMDDYGDIRWLSDYSSDSALKMLSYNNGIARLRNGNFFFGDISTNKIYEVDLLGDVLHSWGLSGYVFHHEVLEKPDGNFLVSATNPSSTHADGSSTIEDYIIEIDRQSANVVNAWDLKESLDEYRTTLTTNRRRLDSCECGLL
jgi:arylsulfate sulfotransferase